jgi:Tfp pilus assembly protein PilN
MFFASYVAVDITNTEIRVMAVSRGKFEKWATAALPEGVVKSGIIREPQAMGVILDNLFKSLKLKKNHVICAVTGLPFIYRTVSMPGTERIPTEAIERESRREMSLGEEDMYLTWQVTETHQTTKEIDYFVLGIPRTSLNPLVEALSHAGIKQYTIDIKPLALARAAALKEALIVSLEQDNIDIVVVADGLVRVIHSFNPGEQYANTIGLVNEIADGLNKATKAFERDFPQKTLPAETPVLLSGKVNADDPLLALVQKAVGRQAIMIAPSLNAPAGGTIGPYAAVIGLVSKKIGPNRRLQEYHDINLDLLKGLKKLHTHKFQTAWILAAVLSLALAVLVYESHELNSRAAAQVSVLQQKADQMNRVLIEAQTVNRQTLTASQTVAEKSKLGIAQLAEIRQHIVMIERQRIDLGSRIAFISTCVPAGADLETLDYEQNTIKITGRAQNGFDVLKMADDLGKSDYFSGVRIEQLAPAKDVGVEYRLSISNNAVDSVNNTPATK